MNHENNPEITLDTIPANRQLIDELWAKQLISIEAREFALDFIDPPRNWGLWAARILRVFGIALILSGIIYFFAFNWAKITPMMKLGSIQLGLLATIVASYGYGLNRLAGRLLLLSSVILIGVFLAVFGQVYQTGADAYHLFMMWALLALPWVVVSDFAILWVLWLIISNIFLILFWLQSGWSEREFMWIFSYLALLNGVFLVLKEYATCQGFMWLNKQWIRMVLVLAILGYVFFPTVMYIMSPHDASSAVVWGTILAIMIHILFYWVYRYRLPSIMSLAATILSAATIAIVGLWKILTNIHNAIFQDVFLYLLMACASLVIFTGVIVKLRAIDREIRTKQEKC